MRQLLQTLANAVRGSTRRPKPGQVLLPRKEDVLRNYPSAGLTPSRLATILREADEGSLSTAMQLFEEMEEKDAHLYSVANTRRLALTGLDWEIVPGAAEGDGRKNAGSAEAAAAYCTEVLRKTETFEEVLQHLALAVGRNIAVSEIIWEFAHGRLQPVEFAPVDFTRLVFDELDIARYEPAASAEEKRELLSMLEFLGANAAGIFSRAVELQVLETGRGTSGPPYERLIEFLNREMSKAWLGQTLTTDISGQRGALAATEVHDQVRQDILADDIRKEARTIRRDLLTPMTRIQLGPDAPVPHFRRRPPRSRQARDLAELLDTAVNRLGLEVPTAWVHEALGVPPAGEGTPAIARAQGDR